MSTNLKPEDIAAIGVIESSSDLREAMYRILDWPDLSPLQRAVCMVALGEGHRARDGHQTVARIALLLGIEDAQVRDAMKGRGLPYSLGYIGRDSDQRLMPTEALAYGVQP